MGSQHGAYQDGDEPWCLGPQWPKIDLATKWHTLLSALPAGLGPYDHFMEGLAAASPLDCEPDVPHDIEFCLQKLKELGSGIHQ